MLKLFINSKYFLCFPKYILLEKFANDVVLTRFNKQFGIKCKNRNNNDNKLLKYYYYYIKFC